MSDKLDKPTIIAGFVALAAVLGLALLANSAIYPNAGTVTVIKRQRE